MSNTLKESWYIVKFYETTRIFFNKYQETLVQDYKKEMDRRAPEHQMDFEEYCLVVVLFMFKENPRRRAIDKLFKAEAQELLIYYQQNSHAIKRRWDKTCDKTLFEWVLTSYDRHKADKRGPVTLHDYLNDAINKYEKLKTK